MKKLKIIVLLLTVLITVGSGITALAAFNGSIGAVTADGEYSHKHTYNKYVKSTCDSSQHWDVYQCTASGCTATTKKNKGDHNSLKVTTTVTATCKQSGKVEKRCSTCNRLMSTETTGTASHSWSSTYSQNDEKHWKSCTVCYTRTDEKSHTYKSGKCSTCGRAEPKCTSSALCAAHFDNYDFDFRNKTAETHDVKTTCTICKVSTSKTGVKHSWENGACKFCGYEKSTDKTKCGLTNTVAGHNPTITRYLIVENEDADMTGIESSYHNINYQCTQCNTRWTVQNIPHDFKSGVCVCGYKKPSSGISSGSTNTSTSCTSGHRFTSSGTCKNCGVKLMVTGGSYSNWDTWSSYSPYNSESSYQSSVTITFNYAPYDVNGNLVSGTMNCTSFVRHNATWHSNTAKAYGLSETSYTSHLYAAGQIGGGTSVSGRASGSTMTFNGIPRGRYFTDVNLNGIQVAITSRRYTSGGSISDDNGPTTSVEVPTTKTYTVVIRHVDTTTGFELDRSQVTVNEGGSTTGYKKDFDGYKFSYEKDPDGKTGTTGTVTVTNINEDKEITFYYSRELAVSVIHYDRSTGKAITTKTYSSPTDFTYNGSITIARLTDNQLKAYGSGYEYENEFEVSSNGVTEKKTGEEIALNNITSYVAITFYYSKPAYVKVVGRVNASPYEYLYDNDVEKVVLTPTGITKNYTAKEIAGFECVGYKMEDTLVSVEAFDELVAESKVSVSLTTASTVKLITFLYKPTVYVSVKHIQYGPDLDEDNAYAFTTLKEEIVTITEAGNVLKKGDKLTFDNSQIENEGLLNYGVYVDDDDKSPQEIEYTKTKYTIDVNITKEKTEVIFYYVKPTLEVEHRFEDKDGNLKSSQKLEEKLDEAKEVPSINIKGKDYVNESATVDGKTVIEVPPTPPALKEQYSVKVEPKNPGVTKVVMVYVYQQKPSSSTNEDDESKYSPVTCDPSVENETVLVDSKLIVSIPNYGNHIDFDEEDYYNREFANQKLVRFPFDVYYEGKLQSANTWIEVANRSKIISEGTSSGKYEFGIPAWTEEKEYTIDVRVVAISGNDENERKQSNDIFNNGAIAYNEIKINVVGKIYDFAVTNLEGDTMYANKLFPTMGTEYRADVLPIGQAGTVSTSYKYGMKLGSTFLFSVNTLGVKNDKIQILPKVYYVSKDGGVATDVTGSLQYKTEKGFVDFENADVKLSTKINKQTRMTDEVRNEVSKSLAMKIFTGYGQDTNVLRTFGTYNKLLIENNLRLPYANYVSELTKNTDSNFNKVLTAANHWYAEYKLPNTLEVKNVTSKDGFYIVCFKIESKDGSGHTYLNYEEQYVGNQWKNENGNKTEITLNLPKVANQKSTATTTLSITDGYYPVAIYQANISVSGDYEISGTH